MNNCINDIIYSHSQEFRKLLFEMLKVLFLLVKAAELFYSHVYNCNMWLRVAVQCEARYTMYTCTVAV